MMIEYRDLPEFYRTVVPTYKSAVYRPFVVSIGYGGWDGYANQITEINEDRAARRIQSYVDFEELDRAREKLEGKGGASIRFGVLKTGRGYHGERGDFCLVGGYAEKTSLHLFYRSLELIGGLGYDICLVSRVARELKIKPKRVSIYAVSANVFALKKNSNEKLFPKLHKVFE